MSENGSRPSDQFEPLILAARERLKGNWARLQELETGTGQWREEINAAEQAGYDTHDLTDGFTRFIVGIENKANPGPITLPPKPPPETRAEILDHLISQFQQSIDGYRAERAKLTGDIERGSWLAVDLATLGEDDNVVPTMLRRTDGVGLIYPGKLHWFQGETESAKSWASLWTIAEILNDGENAIMFDFEDDGKSIRERLASMGISRDVLYDQARFRYVRPAESMNRSDFGSHYTGEIKWALSLFDGVNMGMSLDDLEQNSNKDIAQWVQRTVRVAQGAGSAAVCVDHLRREGDDRFGSPVGGLHKKNIADVSITFRKEKALRRAEFDPSEGVYSLTLVKDKAGRVSQYERRDDKRIADMHITSWPDGGITAKLNPPDMGEWVPNQEVLVAMLRHVETYPGVGFDELRSSGGNSSENSKAIKWAIERDMIRVEKGRKHSHHLTENGAESLKR